MRHPKAAHRYELLPSLVLGFHGTDVESAERVLAGISYISTLMICICMNISVRTQPRETFTRLGIGALGSARIGLRLRPQARKQET